ncbi:biopolymer transporter ExbD [Cobetia marina]|uniref:ExbD/TolR family protein n=1 Tax=Cobetia marina TaxID=28258 RepID=UPI0010AECCF2|nr:biopolymer transporter ExbD [Cobetia marina]TKD64563.1 biopolymer transporter ExbD [Cobetia marina]GED42827.1 biopolymer transporter ExbD [Cobetia marina]
MRFPRRQRESVEVNLTPLIDVVFLLLIFFMVSTTFDSRRALDLILPQSSQASAVEQAPLIMTIGAKGDFTLGDTSLTESALGAALARHKDQADRFGLILEADGRTPHAKVVKALDAAAEVGITRVRISTRTGPDTSPPDAP